MLHLSTCAASGGRFERCLRCFAGCDPAVGPCHGIWQDTRHCFIVEHRDARYNAGMISRLLEAYGLLAAVAGVGIIAYLINRFGRRAAVICVAVSVVVIPLGVWLAFQNPAEVEVVEGPGGDRGLEQGLPLRGAVDDYVTSESCQSCHADEYSSWHSSYHRTMTQAATPEAVVGDFNNRTLTAHGRRYEFSRQGDQYWVVMPDPDREGNLSRAGAPPDEIARVPRQPHRVVMTTGSHHMQTYWVANEAGRLSQVPWYYLIDEQKWIPSIHTFLHPPDSDRVFEYWNTRCIDCHSTSGRPHYDKRTGQMDTQVAELGISCEACHGPGKAHVQYHQNPDAGHDKNLAVMAHPAKLPPKKSAELCAQCHSAFDSTDLSRWANEGMAFRAGHDDLADTHHLIKTTDTTERGRPYVKFGYWSDGTCRTGSDEYMGLIESPCYQRGGLTCISCHSLHNSDPNDQLAAGMQGNQACTQCHEQFQDESNVVAHTHHPISSGGSQCYNCHMPHTTYALFTAMRSHRITSPRVEQIVEKSNPNACNLCHLDETLGWTAQHLEEWYDMKPVKLNDDERDIAASLLWLLKGDAAQRAVTAWNLGWQPAQEASGADWQAPHLAHLLNDSYSTVRLVAYRALRKLDGFEDFDFDFIAEPAERQRSVMSAIEQWKRAKKIEGHRPQILVDEKGVLNQQTVERLLRGRSDPAVVILE